jgi:hypothetical protein
MVEAQRCVRESLAELEHEQWIKWSQAIAPEVSQERQERWAKLWIPYPELTEEQKDQDRVWADKSLAKLHSQGVVLKAERELPELFWGYDGGTELFSVYLNGEVVYSNKESRDVSMFIAELKLKAGYSHTEPLIKGAD